MRYRKRPVVIDAVQWTGRNALEVAALVVDGDPSRYMERDVDSAALIIHTLEGHMRADLNDYIIKGVKGEFYPCKPDIFAATYDRAEPEAREDKTPVSG